MIRASLVIAVLTVAVTLSLEKPGRVVWACSATNGNSYTNECTCIVSGTNCKNDSILFILAYLQDPTKCKIRVHAKWECPNDVDAKLVDTGADVFICNGPGSSCQGDDWETQGGPDGKEYGHSPCEDFEIEIYLLDACGFQSGDCAGNHTLKQKTVNC